MPWKASSVMEERLRFVARLLDGEAMTDVCREFGISRNPDSFPAQTRDLHVSPGVVGFWQGAIRDSGDPQHAVLHGAIAAGEPIGIDLLYGDRDAGGGSMSRFVPAPRRGG